jgi:uncharacterized peroxidase-related enzyme
LIFRPVIYYQDNYKVLLTRNATKAKENDMARVNTPISIEASPPASREILEGVRRQLGSVPNLFRIVGNSPAALEGYVSLNTALGKGSLDAQTRERIALAVAQINDCGYCLAAHTYLGGLVKLSETEIEAARRGRSGERKANAAVEFAVKITEKRGAVSASDVEAVRAAGYSEEEVVEVVANVALNILTNYMNEVLKTEIDFPKSRALAA